MLKTLVKTWRGGANKSSCMIVIPKKMAQEYGVDKESSYVYLEPQKDGIFIRKVDVEKL